MAVEPLIMRCSVCLLTPSNATISTTLRRPSAGRMFLGKENAGVSGCPRNSFAVNRIFAPHMD